MKTIEKKVNYNKYSSKTFDLYFKDKNIAVFDIETTGLYPRRDQVILTGVLTLFKGEAATSIQYFANNPEDEKVVIKKTVELLSKTDLIITYNGASFDIPFIKERANRHNISTNEITAIHLDLYNLVKYHSGIKDLIGSLRQKNLEYYMGLSQSRDDEISGGESVKLYKRYIESNEKDLEKKILLHNSDDILQLAKLIPVIEKTDFHKYMSGIGFTSGDYIIKRINLTKNGLNIIASHVNEVFDYISFPTENSPYTIMASSGTGEIDIMITTESPIKKSQVIDIGNLLSPASVEKIKKYPGYESGYLILKNNGNINLLELNLLVMEFMIDLNLC